MTVINKVLKSVSKAAVFIPYKRGRRALLERACMYSLVLSIVYAVTPTLLKALHQMPHV
jgi:hypothetical protein